MWVVVLGSKGEAADAIRRAQASAEAECGRKLYVCCALTTAANWLFLGQQDNNILTAFRTAVSIYDII
jgi:hypothetical protein